MKSCEALKQARRDAKRLILGNSEARKIMAIIDKPETQDQVEQPHDDNEFPRPLSERDSIAFIEMLENPPAPNEALKAAIRRAKKRTILRI